MPPRSVGTGMLSFGMVSIPVRLYADRQRTQLVAEQAIGPETPQKKFPAKFDGLNHNRVYLELSAQTPKIPLGLYRTLFEAKHAVIKESLFEKIFSRSPGVMTGLVDGLGPRF